MNKINSIFIFKKKNDKQNHVLFILFTFTFQSKPEKNDSNAFLF